MGNDSEICPYVGLQPYTQADQDFFFGRGSDIRIISSNLYAAPLTVLYGASGVGKSSVLLAGVVPHLEKAARTAVITFRDWQLPNAEYMLKLRSVEAVQRACGKPLNLDLSASLDRLLENAAQAFSGSIMIILDQFEEYFLYNPESTDSNSL